MYFPKGNTRLTEDRRPITSISFLIESPRIWSVGESGVTSIEAYDENGHMASIPWIAVLRGNDVVLRVAADSVAISYENLDSF